ncbi:MAG: anaerobic ribonucleoside-triphosphate reductase activating protein [Thermoproteales archaeon]|nr:anaerobic ribonucleoside-triphosphate reductase activating protein [Thermoproteales archaeon]
MKLWMLVGGWVETSLVDVLEHVSFTLWLSHCNFKCPWCSNWAMARGLKKNIVSLDTILKKVVNAAPFIDYFHVTGGEPTLQYKTLYELFKKIRRSTGVLLSLDTNGSLPYALRKLLPLLDHVAMDVKAPLGDIMKYSRVVGLSPSLTRKIIPLIRESLKIIETVPFLEIRTTIVPGLVEEKEVVEVARFLRKELKLKPRGERAVFVVQQFIPYEGVPKEYSLKPRTPPSIVREIALKVAEVLEEFEVYYRTLEDGSRKIK